MKNKIFLISRRLTGSTEVPELVFIDTDINQAKLIFEDYTENKKGYNNYIFKIIAEIEKDGKINQKCMILKRIYKNKKAIKEEYEQKKIFDGFKKDKGNEIDNIISIFGGKIIK